MLEATVAAQMRVAETSVARTLKLLKKFDEETLLKQQEADSTRLEELSRKIRPYQAQNWELEKELTELDSKIANILTLRNQASRSLSRHNSTTPKAIKEGESTHTSPFDGAPNKLELFEQMFSLLIHDPKYLAHLSHRCPKADCDDFVKTVVVDVFGGRPRLEVLELKMFEDCMRIEFERCQRSGDIGSLFRSGTASMQMLKEYALSGEGKEVIRRILDEPINSLSELDLNLEIESIRMYKEFIRKYEKDTHKKWPHEREVSTAEEAFNKSYIQKLYKPRVKQLEYVTDHFLKCVINKHETLPWGVRWISMKLAEFGQEYFPHQTPYQWGSIVGGFLFLRLLNPAIIGPQFFNILETKPSKNSGRTLQFTAKILMKLLNGTQFNEPHMMQLNEYLTRKKETVQSFIVKLISVPDLNHRMDMYRLLKYHNQRDITVQTSYNQLILVHRLLVDNKDLWKDPNDPMMRILATLGPYIPYKSRWKRKENKLVTLHLSLPGEDPATEAGGVEVPEALYTTGEQDAILKDTFSSLQSFANQINTDNYTEQKGERRFYEFLQHVKGLDNDDSHAAAVVLDNLDRAVAHISETNDIQMDSTRFLIQYTEQLRQFRGRVKNLAVHTKTVEKAHRYIRKHNKFLQSKLNSYRTVYQNVYGSTFKSPAQSTGPSEVTFTHKELDSQGIILWVDPKYEGSAQKYCKYTFRRVTTGIYEVQVVANWAFFTRSVFEEPVKISLLELVELERNMKDHLRIYDIVSLNVALLKSFLQNTFKDY